MVNSKEILALDIGEKRIGVARMNSIAQIPEPLEIIKVDGGELESVARLLDKYHPTELVVGLPRNMNGQETKQSQYVRAWVKNLQGAVANLPKLTYVDETLTSVSARDARPAAKYIDDLAAAEILKIHALGAN